MITGVAIKLAGIVHQMPMPNRHHHLVAHMCCELNLLDPLTGEMGFVTDGGAFLGREAALNYALQMGQVVSGNHYDEKKLISQDLW